MGLGFRIYKLLGLNPIERERKGEREIERTMPWIRHGCPRRPAAAGCSARPATVVRLPVMVSERGREGKKIGRMRRRKEIEKKRRRGRW